MVLLAEFDDPLFEDHVVETSLFAGPFGRLVIPPPPVPVALIFLIIRYKLTLLALSKELLVLQVRGEVKPWWVRFARSW